MTSQLHTQSGLQEEKKKEGKRKRKVNQTQLAKQLGISKSYLSMILSGRRQCPPELMEKLQSTLGIHEVVNNQLWIRTGSQKVVGLNPISSTNSYKSPPSYRLTSPNFQV